MPSERSKQVLQEMVMLTVDVIKLCQQSSLPVFIVSQVSRSVSSIGANFSEAQDASSSKDFINKIYIAKKEAAETKYWLTVVANLTDTGADIESLSNNAQQFTMMLQKIINTSKAPLS